MGIVSSKEIAKVIHLDKFGFIGTFVGWVLMKVLCISQLNKIMKSIKINLMLHFLMLF